MNTPPVPRRPRTRPTPRSQHKTTPTVDPSTPRLTDAQREEVDQYGRFIIVGSLCMLFLFCVLQITNAPTWGYAVFLPLGLVVITAAARRGIAHAKQ